MRSPSSCSWFTHCSWLSSSCCLKCCSKGKGKLWGGRAPHALLPPMPMDSLILSLPLWAPTSYSRRTPTGSPMRSLQSCCRIRCCWWASVFSCRVQPCRCVYRLPRLCPRHEAAFCTCPEERGPQGGWPETRPHHPGSQAKPPNQPTPSPNPIIPVPLLPAQNSPAGLDTGSGWCLRPESKRNAGPVRGGVQGDAPLMLGRS